MKCPHCGEDAPQDARFCPSCRADLDADRRAGALPQLIEAPDPSDEEERQFGRGYDFAYTVRQLKPALLSVGAVAGGCVAVVAGAAAFYGLASTGWSMTLAVSALVSVTFAWLRYRRPRPIELLPMLQQSVSANAIAELEDVQFALRAAIGTVKAGTAVPITVIFQNCVNRARNVHVRLDPSSGEARGWKFHETGQGRLGPGEMAELTLWVVAPPGAARELTLHVKVQVAGRAARRVRHAWAREYKPPVDTADQIAGLAIGLIRFGGGWALRFALDEQPVDGALPVLNAREWKVTASPETTILLRASA